MWAWQKLVVGLKYCLLMQKTRIFKLFLSLVLVGVIGSSFLVGSARADDYSLDSFRPDVYAGDTGKYFGGVINLVFVVAFALVFFYLLYGAVGWISSSGDASKLEAAKNRMLQAIVGVFVLACVWAIYTFIIFVITGGGVDKINIPKITS